MNSKWLWDRLAGNWDKPGISLGENDVKIIEKTKKYIDADSIVMDYGCATGSICLEMAGAVKEVHGIDISPKMIDIAKRKAAERKVKNVTFSQATIYDERFKKKSFDAILALNILHLLEKTPQVISRINYLLKPGGVLISATPCLGQKKIVGILLVVPLFLMSKIGILPAVKFFSLSGLKKVIANNRFQIIETESLSLPSSLITEVFIAARKN
jgi:2-polyprenyl-3-methyl-5-hydroxy-6-metoxy-1,4-benzoquinol methylase